MLHLLWSLAQIDTSKIETGAPALVIDTSSAMTWAIAGLLVAGILAITFKTSKRNNVQAD